MKTKIELFLMKNCRSENLKTKFWRKYDMTKVSALLLSIFDKQKSDFEQFLDLLSL